MGRITLLEALARIEKKVGCETIDEQTEHLVRALRFGPTKAVASDVTNGAQSLVDQEIPSAFWSSTDQHKFNLDIHQVVAGKEAHKTEDYFAVASNVRIIESSLDEYLYPRPARAKSDWRNKPAVPDDEFREWVAQNKDFFTSAGEREILKRLKEVFPGRRVVRKLIRELRDELCHDLKPGPKAK